MKDLLKKLISLKNPTFDVAANEKALLFCQDFLEEKGIKSEIRKHTEHPSLEWGAPLAKAKILLNTHIDVVPAPDACFIPQIKGSNLLGRGAADTKAMVAIFLSLDKQDIDNATKAGVRFVVVSDEEIGGDTTKAMLPKMKKLEFALFGEPTQLKLNNEAKGIMQVRITSEGKNTHGSCPWLGENAIILLMQKLQGFLEDYPQPREYTWETTFNFSQIQGGTAINQVPAQCELLCDVRFKPGDSPEEIVKNLRRHFGKGNIEVIRKESHIFTQEDNSYIKLLAQKLAKYDIEPKFVKELGSSDARHCTQLEIPTLVFGPVGGGLHEDEEWLELASLDKTKTVLTEFLQEIRTL
jgi:succinyl-diaminopimelate desuccinylase